MITLSTLLERREQIRRLAERYRTGDVRVFGSVARGDNTGASDVDLLVTPRAGCSLFDLGGLLGAIVGAVVILGIATLVVRATRRKG